MFCSVFCVGLYPLFEGRHSMANTFKSIVRDLSGRGGVIKGRAAREGSGSEESTSPVEGGEKVPVVTEKSE